MATRLRLLGRARVFDGDRWIEAPYDKRFALLAYLACARGAVERERLAFLFWPDVEEERARRDLRHLIYRTKALSFASDLEIGPDRLAWRVETDVESLARAATQRDWAAAVALYEGQLLAGMDLASSSEFMSWLELERENRHDLWRGAVIARASELEAASRHEEAAALLKVLVDAAEFDEEALRLYLRNSHLAGRSEEALRTYQRFADELERGLGLQPLPSTQEVAAALRSELLIPYTPGGRESPRAATSGPGQPGRVRNFPSEVTPFIGRDRELTEIVDLLNQRSCRLLTLLGPGGIGKTRLAQEAAVSTAAGHGDGAAFVSLASIDRAEWLAPAIADALSLSFYDQREPEAQLGDYLSDKDLLLVLDNLEQLPDGFPFIANLLDGCPRLQILATSRVRLNLTREWSYRVDGLSISSSDGAVEMDGGDAAQLFLRCARRVKASFQLDEVDRGSVVRICQVVGGAPLGIELAAGWLEMLSCREIVETLSEEGFDFLASSLHGVPERHRSLRDVFEHSWRFLEDDERTAFARLSVFRGGFTRTSAVAVTSVGSRLLRSLLEKSLVTRDPGGRFDLHELAKQYASEKLSESRETEAECRTRHAAHFAAFLHERERWLRGGKLQEASLAEINQEIENVRRAWEWAVETRDTETLELAAGSLRFYCQTRGLYREGEEAFRRGAAAITQESSTYGTLLLYHGLFTYWLDRPEEALETVKRSLTTLLSLKAASGVIANACFLLGLIHRHRGEPELAKTRFNEALALAREVGERYFEARSLQGLGWIAESEGALDEAERYYRQCIAVLELSEDRYGLAMASFNLGVLLERSGRPELARVCYLEGLEAGRAVGSGLRTAEALVLLGRLHQERGEHQQAEARYTECLAAVAGHDDEPFRVVVKHCLVGLGETAAASHKFPESLHHFNGAVTTSLATKDSRTALRSVVGMAEALVGLGDDEKALTLLAFAKAQAGGGGIVGGAEGLHEHLAARLPDAAAAAALARGRTMRFSEMAALLNDRQMQIPG